MGGEEPARAGARPSWVHISITYSPSGFGLVSFYFSLIFLIRKVELTLVLPYRVDVKMNCSVNVLSTVTGMPGFIYRTRPTCFLPSRSLQCSRGDTLRLNAKMHAQMHS